ncbi:branched-chain amino acid ABC transporter permease [Verticiella sediminum]|uniref:Branched-chain amino acid ABC transporter permease n=1 Tax=Verticiella sediminum TaxID=1247510 RepID=A0A556B300_9BURK|nr:branched-chain amino acid ABC transporter permease [Verticiella sediminum]TSH99215.1 branched-chain amino acid ABC transporter permease [Verticiella sediminum]
MDSLGQFAQLLVAGLTVGSIYAIIAVGFNIIFKSTDALNFAQGEWVMMGGMIAATSYGAAHLPLWLSCLVALALVGAAGVVSYRLTVAPLKKPSPMLITMISIGLALCFKSLVMLLLGKLPMGYPAFSGDAAWQVASVSIHPQSLWVMAITIAFMLATHWFFEKTLTGKSMRAVAADGDAAALVGINVKRSGMWTFLFAALAGALAGVIVTPLTFTSYDAGGMLGFKGFSAAMLGGLGNLHGALIGGLLLGIAEALGGGLISSQFKDAVAFVLLLLVLFLRPNGLLGKAVATKV